MLGLLKRLLLGCTLGFALVLSSTSMAGETLQRVVDFQVLKVGMSGNQPPMNAVSKSGSMMGFDVDLAKALAQAMKVKLEIKTMPFGDLMSALEEGEIDMIVSGMGITPERTEMVSFVGPYMMSGKSVLTKDSALAEVKGGDGFNRKDLKLAALQNSTSASFISTVAPQATLIEVENYDQGVAMVLAGEAHGMVADMPACVLAVMRHPDSGLRTLSHPMTVEPIGIAVSKDDPQFLNLVENYLEAYGKMGILTKMREKWFDDNSWMAALP